MLLGSVGVNETTFGVPTISWPYTISPIFTVPLILLTTTEALALVAVVTIELAEEPVIVDMSTEEITLTAF